LTARNFKKNYRSGGLIATVCRLCTNKSRREYDRERSKLPHRVEARRKYALDPKNKERAKILQKAYRKKNRKELNKKWNEYFRKMYHKKYKHDPRFKIDNCMCSNLYHSLHKNGISKNGRKWEDLVGYTLEELKAHLESLWEPWMNWGNHGVYRKDGPKTWQIDHIIPSSLFNYNSPDDEEFKTCWSLKNLQPKEARKNILKGNKYIG